MEKSNSKSSAAIHQTGRHAEKCTVSGNLYSQNSLCLLAVKFDRVLTTSGTSQARCTRADLMYVLEEVYHTLSLQTFQLSMEADEGACATHM